VGSIYGVAWPLANPQGRVAGSNQTCTAGSDTTVITFTGAAAPFAGFYYPLIIVTLALTFGATPPTVVAVKFAVNGGAAFSTINVFSALLVANASICYPFIITGNTSGTLYFPGPATFTVAVNPTAQNVSYVDAFSGSKLFLFRGNDS
jgi:hypothetical protein